MTGKTAKDLTEQELDEIKYLWENEVDISGSQIAAKYGITKNIVLGMARRRKWQSRKSTPVTVEKEPSLFDQRINALHHKMDQILGLAP